MRFLNILLHRYLKQFYTNDFASSKNHILLAGPGDGFDPAIGSYFKILFPEDLPFEERYDFIWHELPEEEKRFNKYPYAK